MKYYSLVKSANWHITTRCNYRCKFCFIQHLDKEITDLSLAESILVSLKERGVEKITFAGGEPLLHPKVYEFTRLGSDLGFTVSLQTNGYLLDRDALELLQPYVDWIGISIDSMSEDIERELGRGHGDHISNTIGVCDEIHDLGINLKINTTVTRLNYAEDMRPLISRLNPRRWKVFQVLHIQGQNDHYYNNLSITKQQFDIFRSLNNVELGDGSYPIFESSDDMVDSYFILSPSGNVVSNSGGRYVNIPLEEILDGSTNNAVDADKYLARGGVYNWG